MSPQGKPPYGLFALFGLVVFLLIAIEIGLGFYREGTKKPESPSQEEMAMMAEEVHAAAESLYPYAEAIADPKRPYERITINTFSEDAYQSIDQHCYTKLRAADSDRSDYDSRDYQPTDGFVPSAATQEALYAIVADIRRDKFNSSITPVAYLDPDGEKIKLLVHIADGKYYDAGEYDHSFSKAWCLREEYELVTVIEVTTRPVADPILALANEMITISKEHHSQGAEAMRFDGLQAFIRKARERFPEKTDPELAAFITEFTGQSCDGMPESEILLMLGYDNIFTSTAYVSFTKNSSRAVCSSEELPDNWSSVDGLMKLTTNYSHTSSSGKNEYYTIWAKAEWLRPPRDFYSDSLWVEYKATYNDDHEPAGYVHQGFACDTGCGVQTTRFRSVTNANFDREDGDLSIGFGDGRNPGIEFTALSAICDGCGKPAGDEFFQTFIRFGITCTEPKNIAAVYEHKTSALTGGVKKYTTAPITMG